jgi:glycerophosphoryl diester phosphodiesterase
MDQFDVSDFSIGHRGASMQFPEHTIRAYKAAQLMGAGITECDVTFTKDLQLVCRHSQCDLHTTTDIVMRSEMNAKCSTPWTPGPWEEGSAPSCCTSDFTLEEVKTLCAKMDSTRGESATTAEEYVYGGTADWRTDVYQNECPEVPTHAESIELMQEYGGKFTPELKGPSVEMPFNGVYTQEDFAQQMIDEYITAGIPPEDVWPQSFSAEDCYYWIAETEYGEQAVALDGIYDRTSAEVEAWHKELSDNHVNIVAPALWLLVDAAPEAELKMTKSHYVESAHDNHLDIIAWTLERTDPGLNGWYWQSLENVALVDGDKYSLLYVLAYMKPRSLVSSRTGQPLSRSLPIAWAFLFVRKINTVIPKLPLPSCV